MNSRALPILTESDKKLPYYCLGAGSDWEQEPVNCPNGYFYQFIYSVKGEGELRTNEQTFRVGEGNAMLLFKGVGHEYFARSSAWITHWVVFDGQLVEHFLKQTIGIDTSCVIHVAKPHVFLSNIHALIEMEKSVVPLKSLKNSSLTYSLLLDILQYTSRNPNSSVASQYSRLASLFSYIEQNYHKPLVLDDLAAVVGITPQHLCSVFKKTTDSRIFQYIHSVRIQKSKELLLQSPLLPIKEIAQLVGFEHVNYYCSIFKKLEHISPTEYRRMYTG
ncbi:AraC family transcriptional regulator [Neobacillus dielmonensis]|uniref:AraC family transcriptional regulator n=1 Tax=Neobacillus dielmonensis TaxID=1347369 RepID=UPI0005A869D8|nr:AraC family transcriptional regulator [Neobacillus dielmonensis]